MTIRSPFKPHYGSTQSVVTAAASASIAIGKNDKTIMVVNDGTTLAFFRTGLSSDGIVSASSADVPVAANSKIYIEKPQDHDTVAYMSAVATTLYIMSGEGGV